MDHQINNTLVANPIGRSRVAGVMHICIIEFVSQNLYRLAW